MDIKNMRNVIVSLSLVFGLLFTVSGIIEIIIGLYSILGFKIELPLFVGDVFGGLALLAVGIAYFLGVKKAVDRDIKAVSYLFTASIIGLGIGVIAFLILISDAIGFLLGFEDWADWGFFNDLTVYLVLGMLAIIPYRIAKIISSSTT